jgi:hypothetical protein
VLPDADEHAELDQQQAAEPEDLSGGDAAA